MPDQDLLAARLEQANAAVIASVRAASPAGWRRPVGDGDHRSTGTLAHHIAAGYEHGLDWAMSIHATGVMPDISEGSLNAENAEHAAANAFPDVDRVVELLDAECAELCSFVRSVSDVELERASHNAVLGRNWTLRDVFETTLRHTERHHEQFRRAALDAN